MPKYTQVFLTLIPCCCISVMKSVVFCFCNNACRYFSGFLGDGFHLDLTGYSVYMRLLACCVWKGEAKHLVQCVICKTALPGNVCSLDDFPLWFVCLLPLPKV